MPAPELRIFQVPDGYTVAGDTDLRSAVNDELLPLVDKLGLFGDDLAHNEFPILSGITDVPLTPAFPIDLAGGRGNWPLIPNSGLSQTPNGVLLEDLLIGPTGYYEARVLRWDDTVIPPSGYALVGPTGSPSSIDFAIAPPSGAKISAFFKGPVPGTQFALPHSDAYDGDNPSFNQIRGTADGVDFSLPADDLDAQRGVVTLGSSASSVSTGYWHRSTVASHFCSEHPNWIPGQTKSEGNVWTGHIDTGPDVFVGLTNYGGDHRVNPVTGTITDPGPMPKFMERDTYAIDHRDGLVIFHEPVDTEAFNGEGHLQKARANFGYLGGVHNATGVTLEPVSGSGGLRFQAPNGGAFPGAFGRPWIGRDDMFTPRNIYVDGEITPTPNDNGAVPQTLTIKTGP